MTRGTLALLAAGLAALGVALAAYSLLRTRQIEARYPPVGRFVTAAGVKLHYVDLPASVPESSDAPAIVFLHGASGNLRDPLLAFRAALEGRHRLIFVDRPGHGYSERGQADDVAAPAGQARILAAFLDRIGVGRAVVVGHSWGAATAAALAIGAPHKTAGLVLVAPATHPWPGGVDWYYRAAAQPLFGGLFARTLVMPVGSVQLDGGLKGVFAPDPVPAGYAEAAAVPLLFRPAEFIANAEDVYRLNASLAAQAPRYRDIAAPTAILSGNRDAVVYEELHSGGLARDIPGARLIWLDGIGHMPHHTATDRVVAAIEEIANLARGRALAMR